MCRLSIRRQSGRRRSQFSAAASSSSVEKNLPWILIDTSAAGRQSPSQKRIKVEIGVCFVQTLQGLRLVARLRGNQDCMNAFGEGKIKCRRSLPIRKGAELAKLITSKLRQSVK